MCLNCHQNGVEAPREASNMAPTPPPRRNSLKHLQNHLNNISTSTTTTSSHYHSSSITTNGAPPPDLVRMAANTINSGNNNAMNSSVGQSSGTQYVTDSALKSHAKGPPTAAFTQANNAFQVSALDNKYINSSVNIINYASENLNIAALLIKCSINLYIHACTVLFFLIRKRCWTLRLHLGVHTSATKELPVVEDVGRPPPAALCRPLWTSCNTTSLSQTPSARRPSVNWASQHPVPRHPRSLSTGNYTRTRRLVSNIQV